ncbi:MAG: patatin-like phospholipase family protein [Maribacter sp.]|nr:patatin-like phospholipase family protein [Maribacter sp.]
MIKNLALKGGGVKGIAYVGALRELEQEGIYGNIDRVSGTSAGAIVAAMIAVGYSSDEIEALMHTMDFKKFKTGWNPIRLFTQYGLYHGDYILWFIHQFLSDSKYKLQKNATFADLKAAGGKELIVFAADLNIHTIAEFSNFKTPQCIVAEAIRASMSIPLFFKAWKFTNAIPNEHIYVDGGLVFNYPLSFFDQARFHEKNGANDETLGLYLESKTLYDAEVNASQTPSGKSNNGNKRFYTYTFTYNNWITSYFKHAFDTLLNAQGIDFMEESHLVSRTVFIDDLGISATDFDLNPEDMDRLVESGKIGAQRYFKWKKTQIP